MDEEKVPVLLLKTKSAPHDGYEEYFETADDGRYQPVFVPVLEHRFDEAALQTLHGQIESGTFRVGSNVSTKESDARYGGIIFTSQRAVEAFTKVVSDIRNSGKRIDDLLPSELMLYVVGPATARGLRALELKCPILGEESGNGEVLAGYMLQHYNALWKTALEKKLSLLFLVGEKRRDIIPNTLQSSDLKLSQQIPVHEVVIYETGEMASFRTVFTSLWSRNIKNNIKTQWVVVFSPAGCKAMLESLGLLDETTGKIKDGAIIDPSERGKAYIATIGPTTRDYLIKEFGYHPDVCAPKPSPQGDSADTSPKAAAGTKRKAESSTSPASKKGKKGGAKQQKTLEETIPKDEEEVTEDVEMKEDVNEKAEKSNNGEEAPEANGKDTHTDAGAEQNGSAKKSKDDGKTDNADGEPADGPEDVKGTVNPKDGAVEKSAEVKDSMPSSILEKGIIYFFARGRVGVEEPESVQDLQRAYIVLRPLPLGAKLGDGPIEDLKNNRLLALPKKVLPKSGRDRFMTFIEKANVSMSDLKDEFMKGSDYETKTAGTRHTPAVAPVGEGVYAITTVKSSSHLAYMLTIPSEIGEVQNAMGIRDNGSFVLSLKNPSVTGPANASLPQGPEFSKDIMEEFRGRAWMSVRAEHMGYENAQLLLIGSGADDVAKALETTKSDEKNGKMEPEEAMDKLEGEDEERVEHLHGDDSVFADLGISKKDYPDVLTTW
ncbi:tetrapyrrole biosynthesis, uroporphyrinogen III synthase [Aulographum hederae CBS 113979]|uniref:Tetrapyrrole biosynthesis, uroporphyrinogen III synthase n=1 Tax=Aulographum hederae CBS 113979 TaxID=1176131 RepID=A0A6G1GYB2_9PEZI|nr:tetrapyrrole biosynthesis, uroporphyrinogen III synthase [Aulographum hederae CBS 113979]